jgi:hypothetical protein
LTVEDESPHLAAWASGWDWSCHSKLHHCLYYCHPLLKKKITPQQLSCSDLSSPNKQQTTRREESAMACDGSCGDGDDASRRRHEGSQREEEPSTKLSQLLKCLIPTGIVFGIV